MTRAFVLIDVAIGMASDVCKAVREAEETVDAYVVAGDYDVVVELEGEDPHALLSTVTGTIRPLEGVGTTRTYVCID